MRRSPLEIQDSRYRQGGNSGAAIGLCARQAGTVRAVLRRTELAVAGITGRRGSARGVWLLGRAAIGRCCISRTVAARLCPTSPLWEASPTPMTRSIARCSAPAIRNRGQRPLPHNFWEKPSPPAEKDLGGGREVHARARRRTAKPTAPTSARASVAGSGTGGTIGTKATSTNFSGPVYTTW
jgi:hypothetical protein